MVHQQRNILLSLKGREIGFRGRNRQNILPYFAEEIAATSSTDNKACNLPGIPRCTFLVTFSQDQKLVASSHGNHTINISRLSTGEHVQTLTGHPRSPWCVTFHPSSNEILASGCMGGEVRVWDLQGSSEVWQSDNHSMIASLSFHPRDQVLAIATTDQILLWDWRQPVPFASVAISSPLEKVRLVRFSPLGHNLLTGIANAPVDEEEPEYENLDVQHEAYQSTARLSRHGVPEHLNPYPRPPRLVPDLHGPYTVSLPSSQGPPVSQRPGRPMSPVHSERLEEAREYAAAVTLTALGLRRVNPASHNFSYGRWRSGDQSLPSEPSDPRESIFSRGAGQQSVAGSDDRTQNEPDRFRGPIRGESGGRSGINTGGSSGESRGETISIDDTGSSEDSQRTVEGMSNISAEEARTYAAQMYVNTDVTSGDEIRLARTSLSIPQTHANESSSVPHVARLQQLPTDFENVRGTQNTSPGVNTPTAASSECDQGNLAPGHEMNSQDLVSGNRCVTLPSTSSQHVCDPHPSEALDVSSTSVNNKDCHSPEAKRHCPDFSGQDQALTVKNSDQNGISHSISGPSSSSACDRSVKNRQSSFSDAEVSSAVRDVELSQRAHGRSSCSAAIVSSQVSSSQSSQGARPQSTDEQLNQSSLSTSNIASSSADLEPQMQPALQTETVVHPQAAIMHRSVSSIADPPRAFTAHLGTIPHTAPPDSTSPSDDDSSQARHIPSQSLGGPSYTVDSTSHEVNSTSSHQVANSTSSSADNPFQINSISQSENGPPPTSSPSSVATVPLPSTSVSYASFGSDSQTRQPQCGAGLGLQRGMRALHFGTVDNQTRIPATAGSNPNPLDLSIARTGSPNQPEASRAIPIVPVCERNPESSGNSVQQACHSSQSETRQEVPLPAADYQPRRTWDTQAESRAPVPQGMDLSIPNVRQGGRTPYAPASPLIHASGARHQSYIPGSYGNQQTEVRAPHHAPGPIPDPPTTMQPTNPFPPGDAASRYRRYNLWRSPGLHRQRLGGLSSSVNSQDSEPLMGDNQGEESRGVVYGARRVAPLQTRRQLHLALLNQPSRQMTDMERMDMAARVQRRLLRQSRQGPLRAQLGRLSGQFAGHHHHSRNSIFDETYQPPPPMIHATINRAIASAFAGRGETAVANNIGNTTYRLQWWDFSEFELPDISDADRNVIVPHCKLHNDASCDMSQDGRYLAAFVPSPLGFPDDGVLAIYSLMPHNFGDVLYTKSFGPNAITVNMSPLGGFVMVGLASRKLHLHMASKQLIGMIYKLHKEGAAEDSLLYVCDLDHSCNEQERRHHVSVNTVKWIPRSGGGLVYGTNRGDLRICTPSNFTAPDDLNAEQTYRPDYTTVDDYPRHDLVHRRRSYSYMYQEFGLRNLGLHARSSSSSPSSGGGVSAPERRARGTQTPQRELFSTATQTDEQGPA